MQRLGPGWQSGARDLLLFVNRLTSPYDHPSPDPALVQRYAQGETVQDRTEDETIGYRLLKMLHVTPAMLEPVADKELQARFVNRDRTIPRAELIVCAWHRPQVLLPDGYYTSAETPEVTQAVEGLLALRTHSEMQIFYKYLSPSGYINARA